MSKPNEKKIRATFALLTGIPQCEIEQIDTAYPIDPGCTIHTKDRTFYCRLTYGGGIIKHNTLEEDTAKGMVQFPHVQDGKKIYGSPLMQQYNSIKSKYPDAVLLFRVGDFYETFHEDAETAARVLGITLTKNKTQNAIAGFPYHSLESYLPKLIRAGYKVAICDQLEDPKLNKKIVKRGVTEVAQT